MPITLQQKPSQENQAAEILEKAQAEKPKSQRNEEEWNRGGEDLSNVEVTVRYHLMTHTLFLAILCLTTVFNDYLSIDSITYSLPITD